MVISKIAQAAKMQILNKIFQSLIMQYKQDQQGQHSNQDKVDCLVGWTWINAHNQGHIKQVINPSQKYMTRSDKAPEYYASSTS